MQICNSYTLMTERKKKNVRKYTENNEKFGTTFSLL